jgi:hypothetical protein
MTWREIRAILIASSGGRMVSQPQIAFAEASERVSPPCERLIWSCRSPVP